MKLIFDHSLSKKLAAALDDLDDENQIVHLRVFFEDAKTPDPQWLRGLAERGEGTSIVYRRYAIVSDADLQEAVSRLTGTFRGTSEGSTVDRDAASSQNHSMRL